jgi:hypothetical protein
MSRSPQNRGSGAVSVRDVISGSDNAFAMLLNQAKSLARLESLLSGPDSQFGSQDEPANFQVAALHQDRLVLITPTAAWATRLRMQTQAMLHFLRASGYAQLAHIDVRVAPLAREVAKPKTPKKPSPAAKLALNLMSGMSRKIDKDRAN